NANPQITDANASLIPNTLVTIPAIGSNGSIYGPPCVIHYTVQAGDTWASIAQTYNADLDVLKQKNSGISFSSGVELLVPLNSAGGASVASTPAVAAVIPTDFPSPFISIRNYPDLNATVIGSVQPGDQVVVIAYTLNRWRWYQLRVPSRNITIGWI